MNFIKAKTAREIVNEYCNEALKRFMENLNDAIEEQARLGCSGVPMDISAMSINDQNFILAFLKERGYTIEKNPSARGVRYWVKW